MRKRIKFPSKRGLNREELELYSRYADDFYKVIKALRKYKNGVTIFGSRMLSEDSDHYKRARELSYKLALNGHTVITGGGGGIMEAGNRGAYEAGGKTVGFNITIPQEQDVNKYVTESIQFEFFATRKLALASCSKVWVFFPGGFGTYDELFEVLTLVRDGKMPMASIFLVGKEWWKTMDDFVRSRTSDHTEFGVIDHKLYEITDNIDEIVDAADRMVKLEE